MTKIWKGKKEIYRNRVEVKTEEKMINGERTDKRYDTLVQET